VSADLKLKSKKWQDFKNPSEESQVTVSFNLDLLQALVSRRNQRRAQRILQPQEARPGGSSKQPQHSTKDPAEPAAELLQVW